MRKKNTADIVKKTARLWKLKESGYTYTRRIRARSEKKQQGIEELFGSLKISKSEVDKIKARLAKERKESMFKKQRADLIEKAFGNAKGARL